MSDNQNDQRNAPEKRKLSMTLGLGFALGVAAFGISDAFLSDNESGLSAGEQEQQSTEFTCSMHPQIRQPEMGPCPLCGMDLITANSGGDSELAPNMVSLSERARSLAKLRTTLVHRRGDAATQLRLLGNIQPDESSLKTVTAWTSGRIDRLKVRVTGESVKAGQSIATLYSPEVFAAHQDLTVAKQQVERLKGASGTARRSADAALKAARERLRLLGVPEAELKRLETQTVPTRAVSIRSPYSGTVIERLASEGAYVQTGTPLYRVAKLDRLWVQLDAYESDLARIKVGQNVELIVDALPGEVFQGKVRFIDPTLDSQRRTARVRVVVSNQDGRLRPGMFVEGRVDAQIEASGDPAPMVIPTTAPLLTGRRAIVYVETRKGSDFRYESRVVRLGPRLGDMYPVIAGLSEGERVVTRGAFVLDADLQIRGGKSMMASVDDQVTGVWDGIIDIPPAARRQLAPVVLRYLEIQDALAHDSLEKAKVAAAKLPTAVSKVKVSIGSPAWTAWAPLRDDIDAYGLSISSATSFESARQGFELLSASIRRVLEQFGNPLDKPLKLAHCPMAAGSEGASWVQQSDDIENAYFGSSMYRCGVFVEEVAPASYLKSDLSNPR